MKTNNEEIKTKVVGLYNVGFRNGGIEMKNKILKSLNRDWKLFKTKPELDLLMKVIKKINRIK